MSYICSRYYRAPELIFGATDYTCCIDVWSAGCVLAELLLGVPLFPGESGVDQLVEIIKVLGTPTLDEIQSMNQNYSEYKFPQVKPHPWSKVFRPRTPPDAIDLVSKLLRYAPDTRLKPLEGCTLPLFDELRDASLQAAQRDAAADPLRLQAAGALRAPRRSSRSSSPIGTSSSSARTRQLMTGRYYGAGRWPARGAKGGARAARRPVRTPPLAWRTSTRREMRGRDGRGSERPAAPLCTRCARAERPSAYGTGARPGAAAKWMRRKTARRRRCATHSERGGTCVRRAPGDGVGGWTPSGSALAPSGHVRPRADLCPLSAPARGGNPGRRVSVRWRCIVKKITTRDD